jgi:hypothetical protein
MDLQEDAGGRAFETVFGRNSNDPNAPEGNNSPGAPKLNCWINEFILSRPILTGVIVVDP